MLAGLLITLREGITVVFSIALTLMMQAQA